MARHENRHTHEWTGVDAQFSVYNTVGAQRSINRSVELGQLPDAAPKVFAAVLGLGGGKDLARVSNKEIAEVCCCSPVWASRVVGKLVDHGFLRSTGSTKGRMLGPSPQLMHRAGRPGGNKRR